MNAAASTAPPLRFPWIPCAPLSLIRHPGAQNQRGQSNRRHAVLFTGTVRAGAHGTASQHSLLYFARSTATEHRSGAAYDTDPLVVRPMAGRSLQGRQRPGPREAAPLLASRTPGPTSASSGSAGRNAEKRGRPSRILDHRLAHVRPERLELTRAACPHLAAAQTVTAHMYSAGLASKPIPAVEDRATRTSWTMPCLA